LVVVLCGQEDLEDEERLQRERDAEDQEGGEGEGEGGEERAAPRGTRSLEEVVQRMQAESALRPALAQWLLQQARQGNEFVLGAYDVYRVRACVGEWVRRWVTAPRTD
jgi:hypothetical protein